MTGFSVSHSESTHFPADCFSLTFNNHPAGHFIAEQTNSRYQFHQQLPQLTKIQCSCRKCYVWREGRRSREWQVRAAEAGRGGEVRTHKSKLLTYFSSQTPGICYRIDDIQPCLKNPRVGFSLQVRATADASQRQQQTRAADTLTSARHKTN